MTSTPRVPHDKLLDLLLDVVCVVDIDGRFLSVSEASERVFGYLPEEMIGRSAFELMHPDDRAGTRALIDSINSGTPNPDHENRYIHKQGHVVHIMWSAQWLESEQVRVGVARDVTERRRAEAMQAALYAISEAAHSARDLQTLYERVHEVIGRLLSVESFCVVSYDGATDQLSFPYYADPHQTPSAPSPPAFMALSSAVIRSRDALLLSPESDDQLFTQLGLVELEHRLNWLGVPLLSGANAIGALVLRNKAGSLRYSEQDKTLLQFVSDHLAAAIERKHTHSRLEFLAHYDHLTELPNRALFLNRLHHCLQKAQGKSSRLAVLYLDLDDFKYTNDNYGHAAGDTLLREVAKRLKACVRDSDVIGRLGGDEFAVLLGSINTYESAFSVAQKIVSALNEPYPIGGETVLTGASIGVAVYPEHGTSSEQLLRRSDQAMYEAKRNGRSTGNLSQVIPAPEKRG